MRLGTYATLLLTGLLLAAPSFGQDTEDCHACHEDADMVGTRDGVELSVHVVRETYEASVHGWMDCVDCHADIAEIPHEDDLAVVNCASCHEDVALHGDAAHVAAPGCAGCHGSHDVAYVADRTMDCKGCHRQQAREHAESLHGRAEAQGEDLAPSCVTCHGAAHEVRTDRAPGSPIATLNIPFLCGQCHREGTAVSEKYDIPQDHIIENYSMSIHGEGLFRGGLTVTAVCTSCHTSHRILEHTDPESSIHHDNVAETCEQCHGQIETVHQQVIDGRLWAESPDMIPSCIDCHSPHRVRQAFYPAGLANQDCLECHADPSLTTTRDGRQVSLTVDEVHFAGSAHNGTTCAQCHTQVQPGHDRPCAAITQPVDCSVCHAGVVELYDISSHGVLNAKGDPDAPGCTDCHTRHAMQKKDWPSSPTFARNVPELCASCHRAGQAAAVRIESDIPDIFGGYLDSIHGKGLVDSGLLVTATCADCHSAHGELPAADPRSTVHASNVSDTCGSCHHGVEETFRGSVHWPGEEAGDHKLPTCEDCHSSHTIGRTGESSARLRMMDQCGKCHEHEAETFFETFHGKVSQLGTSVAAMCHDCHGTHNILPTTVTESTLSRDNVVATCGQCHEGSHRRFAGYLTHATHHDKERYPWLFWSFWFMVTLLVGTLTFATLHTIFWLIRLWLSRDEWRSMKERTHSTKQRYYRRFDYLQRNQHLTMMLSFFTLALTGMVLKFSFAGWAQWVAKALGGFETTGVLHRIGAIVLFGVTAFHIWDVRRRRKKAGKTWLQMIQGPDSILFTPRDIREVFQSIKWFLGVGPRPNYGRFTYWEKFDYFAVFWGVIVIGGTGLLLWFPETFTRVLPGWSVNVATVIHSDEALLAVAFIFTIHFFNTHFRPDKFPMDMGMFTGRVPLDELAHDKPDEYADLMADPNKEDRIVEQFAPPVVRGFKVFGMLALAVGLTMIFAIIYTMIFGYR